MHLTKMADAYYITLIQPAKMRYNLRNNQVDRLKAFRGRASCATRI